MSVLGSGQGSQDKAKSFEPQRSRRKAAEAAERNVAKGLPTGLLPVLRVPWTSLAQGGLPSTEATARAHAWTVALHPGRRRPGLRV